MPAGVDVDALVRLLVERSAAADPDLAKALGIDSKGAAGSLPRLVARSAKPQRLVAIAATERAVGPLEDAARRTGWRVSAASPETVDPLAMTHLILDPSVDTVLLGRTSRPGADERRALDDVAALVAAVATRRPELGIILAGSMSERLAEFEEAEGERQGEILLAPAATAGDPPGSALRDLLDDLRAPRDDARRAIARSAAASPTPSIVGWRSSTSATTAGSESTASPGVAGAPSRVVASAVAAAALVPPDPDDAAVDRVLAWSTLPIDRHRLRDRLRELRLAPWADAAGEGARLRLAAARAALGVLVDATPEQSAEAPPDIIVASGGAWAVAPGPAIALAIADVVRRPAAVGLAYDHARLLGPLGSIPDATERRQLIADISVPEPVTSIADPRSKPRDHDRRGRRLALRRRHRSRPRSLRARGRRRSRRRRPPPRRPRASPEAAPPALEGLPPAVGDARARRARDAPRGERPRHSDLPRDAVRGRPRVLAGVTVIARRAGPARKRRDPRRCARRRAAGSSPCPSIRAGARARSGSLRTRTGPLASRPVAQRRDRAAEGPAGRRATPTLRLDRRDAFPLTTSRRSPCPRRPAPRAPRERRADARARFGAGRLVGDGCSRPGRVKLAELGRRRRVRRRDRRRRARAPSFRRAATS